MTTHYQSNDGILTNNDSESYNYRIRTKLGAQTRHPNLPEFMGAIQEENTQVEIDWMVKDKDNRSEAQRKEFAAKLEDRNDWEQRLNTHLNKGIMDDEIFELLDEMVVINRAHKKKKWFVETDPNQGRGRGRGQGRGRGKGRGPIRPEVMVPAGP